MAGEGGPRQSSHRSVAGAAGYSVPVGRRGDQLDRGFPGWLGLAIAPRDGTGAEGLPGSP